MNRNSTRRGVTQELLIGQVKPDVKQGKNSFCDVGLAPNLYGGLRSGFTLIELLVVVIIIGILAAIALPQYNKAILKSRMTEYEVNLKTLAIAEESCYLNKGSLCTKNELDIGVPSCTPLPGMMNTCRYDIKRGGSIVSNTSTTSGMGLYFITTDDTELVNGVQVSSAGMYCVCGYMGMDFCTTCQKLGFTEMIKQQAPWFVYAQH